MNWLRALPWRWGRGTSTSPGRQSRPTRLHIETLEDRLAPSTTTLTYQQWRQETFTIDDTTVQTTVPQNQSFGAMIGMPSVFADYPYRGDGYSVAVIDTGIDYGNPNLGGGFGPGYKVIAGWNFVNNTANPMDDNGHGTAVAGIIASSSATYAGVAPDVNLIALKVLDASGSGTFGNVQNALDWVVANRAKYNIIAVNMSLGSGNYTASPYTYLDSDLGNLTKAGVFISVAAGNSFYEDNSQPGLDFPAVDSYVVSVGAVYDGNFGPMAWASGARDYSTAPDQIASFSQRGSALSILAPGAMITCTSLNDTLVSMAGTSMAAPVITGSAVLIREALDAMHKTANESTILGIMKSTGVSVKDVNNGQDNVVNTGLTFQRIDLAAALNAVGKPAGTTPAPSAPVLQPIANQTLAPGGSLTLTLNGSDPNGLALSYSASVLTASAGLAYQLKQQLGLTYAGSYYTNEWGQNEKSLSSTSKTWYILLPTGALYRWTGSIQTTLAPANQVAMLDPRYYADPSLLWNAQPTAAPSLKVSGNQLAIQAAANVSGSYQIQVTVNNGKATASETFTLTVQAGSAPSAPPPPTTAPPVLQAIANQTLPAGGAATLTLKGSDPNSLPLTYAANVIGSTASLAYQLKQQLGLTYAGSYYTDTWGHNEKSLTSTSKLWYILLPSGALYRWAGSIAATLTSANLIATLGASFYADPSLLWNAQPPTTTALVLKIAGNQLTIEAPAGVHGSWQVQVTVSNGKLTATQTFTVTV